MKRSALSFFLIMILGASSGLQGLENAKVMPATQRTQELAQTRAYLDLKDELFLEIIENLLSPFDIKRDLLTESDFIKPEGYIPSDKEILNYASQRLKPSGVVRKNNKGLLIFDTGQRLEEGAQFIVKIQDKRYVVSIQRIESDRFVLKRNAELLIVKLE